MPKISIRFFNNREIRIINDEEDSVKAGKYWQWLKKKFETDGIQLVSVTHDFKFEVSDGKKRLRKWVACGRFMPVWSTRSLAKLTTGNYLCKALTVHIITSKRNRRTS